MSGLFQIIDGEKAVIVENGVYKEVDVAKRFDGELYVKAKGGFVRIYANGSTSAGSKCRLDTITITTPFYKDKFGKLYIEPDLDNRTLIGEPSFLAIEKA